MSEDYKDASLLSHFDPHGQAVMIDISDKDRTDRTATASGKISMRPETFAVLQQGTGKKGDVLGVARLAGIMATKRTADLIPLCHPIALTSVRLEFIPDEKAAAVFIEATVKTTGQTGVEMEALTAVSVAALTIYDMLKAVDRTMEISEIRLNYKAGGKSGIFISGRN